ncbi:MAG: aminoglycoside phosphotransferase family protein [Nocardioides sp.]
MLDDGHVLTDHAHRLPACDTDRRLTSLTARAEAAGDPAAVLVAPQLQVGAEPVTLLSVFAPRRARVPGVWTRVTDLAEDPAVVEALLQVDAIAGGREEPPARRPDWFRTAWYDEAEAWVDDVLARSGRRRTGPAQATKAWSMSAVLRVPCDPAPVWLKASTHHFHAEPALTRLVADLAPDSAPIVVETDDERGWLLTEDLAGADEDAAPEGVGVLTARTAATLQLRSLERRADLEAAGAPVRDLTRTGAALDEILTDGIELGQLTDDERTAARAARDGAHAVLAELDAIGLPDTLVHGDLHTGNVAHHDGALALYDWSDACISHPFLDVVHLGSRLPDDERAESQQAFADTWRAAYPGIDTDRALTLAVDANQLFQMVTFEQIYRAQEDASYWEMSGVVADMLRELPARFGSAGGRRDPGVPGSPA